MSQYLQIHPTHPQQRLVSRAVAIARNSGVIIYPTDSCYALGCCLGDKSAMERMRRIRRVDQHHNFTLVCRNLSEIGAYAKMDNAAYRLLRAHTPGPYTFIFKATREVPRRLQNKKKNTIGVRIPDHTVTRVLLEALGEPFMSTTLILPGETIPMTDTREMETMLKGQVDLIVDGGNCGTEPTTVIDLTNSVPRVARHGLGDATVFEAQG